MEIPKIKTIKMKRSDIEMSPYNPRKIKDKNRLKLKKSIKEFGLVENLVVNLNTNRVVGGHQRLSILDDLSNNEDYELEVTAVKLSEAKEKKLNVLLNQRNLQGETDSQMLIDMLRDDDAYKEISLGDLGYDSLDIEKIGLDSDLESLNIVDDQREIIEDLRAMDDTLEVKKEAVENNSLSVEDAREYKKKIREEAKIDNALGEGRDFKTRDYSLTIQFGTNIEKQDFCTAIGQVSETKFIRFDDLLPFLQKINVKLDDETGIFDITK